MLQIRPMTDDEIDDVARVHVRSWQSGYAGIVPDDYLASLDPAGFASRHRERVLVADSGALVAAAGERIVGLASYGPYRAAPRDYDRSAGELYAIYVDPEHWGAGAGHRLFAAAQERLAAAGFPAMRLWVLEDNQRARRFYERQGMRPDGVRELWTPRGHTAELPELRYAVAL